MSGTTVSGVLTQRSKIDLHNSYEITRLKTYMVTYVSNGNAVRFVIQTHHYFISTEMQCCQNKENFAWHRKYYINDNKTTNS